jgi:hypothetical protein
MIDLPIDNRAADWSRAPAADLLSVPQGASVASAAR